MYVIIKANYLSMVVFMFHILLVVTDNYLSASDLAAFTPVNLTVFQWEL